MVEGQEWTPWGVVVCPQSEATVQSQAELRRFVSDCAVPWAVRSAVAKLVRAFPGVRLAVLEPWPFPVDLSDGSSSTCGTTGLQTCPPDRCECRQEPPVCRQLNLDCDEHPAYLRA